MFLYRIGKCPRFYGEYFRTYVFTVAVDGTFLWRLPLIEGAFHDFGAHGRLLISDKVPSPPPQHTYCTPMQSLGQEQKPPKSSGVHQIAFLTRLVVRHPLMCPKRVQTCIPC